jgi:hypothetical protein
MDAIDLSEVHTTDSKRLLADIEFGLVALALRLVRARRF